MMKIAVIAPGALPEEAKMAMKADMLTYAEPGHPEFLQFKQAEAVVVTVGKNVNS